MFRLNFTTKVMGEDGAERVRRHAVTQTLRSPREDIVVAFLSSTLKVGDKMEVALDGEVIGEASPSMIDRIDWDGVTLLDAQWGGFSSMPELSAALQRAGYRFSPMNTYLFYRVQFQWLNARMRGLTLIEFLIIVAVLAILAAVVVPPICRLLAR